MSQSDYSIFISMGNLTRDPEQRPLGQDRFVTTFGFATSHSYRDSADRLVEEMMPITVEVFGRLGDACAQYLRKGSRVMVEGRLRYDSWLDAQQQKRSRHVLVAAKVKFLDSRSDERPEERDGIAGEISPPPLSTSRGTPTTDDPPF
jgi:single-strand DNA-binding protein